MYCRSSKKCNQKANPFHGIKNIKSKKKIINNTTLLAAFAKQDN
jgi:hypothetical protein